MTGRGKNHKNSEGWALVLVKCEKYYYCAGAGGINLCPSRSGAGAGRGWGGRKSQVQSCSLGIHIYSWVVNEI